MRDDSQCEFCTLGTNNYNTLNGMFYKAFRERKKGFAFKNQRIISNFVPNNFHDSHEHSQYVLYFYYQHPTFT